MTILTKGANAPVGGTRITAELRSVGDPVDLSALLIGAGGKVRSDADMVFFNQPDAEAGAVRHLPAGDGGGERIVVEPSALPASVESVLLVGSCDPDDTSRTFSGVKDLSVRALEDGREPVVFEVPPMTDGERAAVLLEIYRRGDGWKIRAVGQGYADGLAGVATDFGIDVADDTDEGGTSGVGTAAPAASGAAPPAATMPTPVPAPAAAVPPAAGAAASPFTKVTISLEKGQQASISLDKQDPALEVVAALEWDGGSDSRREQGADLDFYALFVPASKALRGPVAPGTVVKARHEPGGTAVRPGQGPAPLSKRAAKAKAKARAGAVYYRNLGSLTAEPYILLDGDSRIPGRETIRIVRPDEQGYVLLCAYSAVQNGAGSFQSFGAQVVVSDGRGSTVTVPLFEDAHTRYWVAIALVDFTEPGGAAIRQVEAYSSPGSEARPGLHIDGTIKMDAGPVEFK
ncbi:TerD family protein [Streptomyces sp. NPDC051018]|uniref:TerD family protein n=1 Tax=Streptomyces sp. NPDC051018 TaxID=3365639 RepID=UPI0037ADFB81